MTYHALPNPSDRRFTRDMVGRDALSLTQAGWEEWLRSSVLLPGLVAGTLAACAITNTSSPNIAIRVPRSNAGTIVSVRPVRGQHAPEPRLAAFLANNGGGQVVPDKSLAEFIVRSDDGATISVVQPNEPALLTGGRVVIMREGETRLAPSG